jgi:hypothetical protein
VVKEKKNRNDRIVQKALLQVADEQDKSVGLDRTEGMMSDDNSTNILFRV